MPKFHMGVLGNQLSVNSNSGHENFARQYQRSEFWYQQEAAASNRAQVLRKNRVVVNDATVLPAMLRVPRTIWWQNTFVVKDVAEMQRIMAQVPGTCWHSGFVTAAGKVLKATQTIVSWSRGVGAQLQPSKSCYMETLTCQMVQYHICWAFPKSKGEC